MNGLFTLLSLSIVMGVASFLAGILPLSFSLSRGQLRLISTVGMGVLVGTSLIVIIPEGVETLYTSGGSSHSQVRRTLDTPASKIPSADALSARHVAPESNSYGHRDLTGTDPFNLPGPVIPDDLQDPPKTPTEPGKISILGNAEDNNEAHEDPDHEAEAHHAWIGVALISGFILMFLIDRVPQLASTPQLPAKIHRNIALNQIGRRFNLPSSTSQDAEEAEGFIDSPQATSELKRGFATTIGLVIHAAADGIALGASSSTSQTGLSLIIFFAIMIHKAPAAFGLTSILLRQGLAKRAIKAHLIIFSLAAPVGALLTWMAAQMLGYRAANSATNTKWWTGVLLLFSAGTFLYVAMHSMQEVLGSHHERHDTNGQANGQLERRDSMPPQDDQKPSFTDLGAALFGMILPLFLQIGHAH